MCEARSNLLEHSAGADKLTPAINANVLTEWGLVKAFPHAQYRNIVIIINGGDKKFPIFPTKNGATESLHTLFHRTLNSHLWELNIHLVDLWHAKLRKILLGLVCGGRAKNDEHALCWFDNPRRYRFELIQVYKWTWRRIIDCLWKVVILWILWAVEFFIIKSSIHEAEEILVYRKLQMNCIENASLLFLPRENISLISTETDKKPLKVTENSSKLTVTKYTKKNSFEIVTRHHCSEHNSYEVTGSDTLDIQIMLCGKVMWALKSWVSWM